MKWHPEGSPIDGVNKVPCPTCEGRDRGCRICGGFGWLTGPAALERLMAGVGGPVDTSDIPERTGSGRKVRRDASGRLIKDEGDRP